MTTLLRDHRARIGHTVASGHDDRRREVRDRGHQLRAARRRSGLSRLKPASARSGCRTRARREIEATSPQVTSGDYDDTAGGDGGLSCLANGTTRPISEIEVGDQVLATDPATGETTARTVTDTHVMLHDGDLLDVAIEDDDGHGVIFTTDEHQFWSITDQAWVPIELDEGDQLRQADGSVATVADVDERPGRQDMHDLTVEVDHNFYVATGDEAEDLSALVHNAGPCGVSLTQERLEHIVQRHWSTSDAAGAGKFSPGTTARSLRDDIYEAVGNGTSRPNTGGRAGTIYERDMGRTMGVDINGASTSRLRVVVAPDGTVITAFPY